MVKTRHSADAGDVSFEEFVSIQSQRTRRSHQYNDQINGYDSDTSGEITLSPRRGKAGRRVVDADSSIDDATPDKPIRKDLGHNDADDERELVITGSGRATRHRPRRIVEVVEEPVMNGDFDVGTRRSTRQRKLLYSTFNQSLIEKHLDLVNDTATASSADDEVQPPRRKRRRQDVEPLKQEELGADMYTRVKRVRRQVKRDMYGMVINEDNNNQGKGNCDDGDSSDESDSTDSESDNSDEANEKEEKAPKQYFLRQHKPQTNLYTVPIVKKRETSKHILHRGYFLRQVKPKTDHYRVPIEPKRTRPKNIFGRETPPRQVRVHQSTTSYRSPAHRSPFVKRRRRRPAFHGNSSTSSSSSSSDSDDGRRFERRKAKSMAKARNRCLPMNFAPEDVATGYVRDRVKIGSSLADIDPMNVDRSVSFESVGGLGKHLQALKEMIVFPLLYPEVFDRFKISPPRGVLFYGPPGTGKTLVARALANECSTGDKKVAFFMRKGADCLSKWVGESERQLRLLFDQAYQMRPSIIFFDEIDGLAPVRSSRQDQIHSSIVSTLLALMDGLDNRGEIVVIGATNRIDSIDPALRRPGRFDREFLFPLPSIEARKQILQIHTKEWNPKLCDAFMLELAGKCVGYCGADLKALCTEGALHALRRRYPQIYTSNDKLELDVTSIEVSAKDFHRGMQNIVPASQRSVTSPGRVLAPIVRPLLKRILQHTLETVERIFPTILAHINKLDAPGTSGSNGNSTSKTLELTWYSDDDDDAQPIFEQNGRGNKNRKGVATDSVPRLYLDFNSYSYQRPVTNRPRLLLSGHLGQGQSSHLGPAVLHHLERLPVFVLDLPALYAVSAKTPEESCAQIFREACRASPSIVYMPHIGHLWDVISDTLRATFIHMLRDLQPSTPILLIATCEQKHSDLHPQVQQLFDFYSEVIVMQNPNSDERREFFQDLLLNQTKKPPPLKKNAAKHMLEQLPKAKPPEPRKLTETELKKIKQQEDASLRELRLFLRDVINKLGRDRKFGIFSKPVDIEEVTDYYDIIKEPMDLSTMMSKIDLHKYQTVNEFMDNINLICSNALEYNPDKDPAGRAIRHRACALRDTTQAILAAELDPEFEKLCEEIVEARKRRGEKTGEDVPSYYFTKPLTDTMRNQLNIPSRLPQRYSRQTRGLNTDAQVEVDDMNIVNQELQTNSEPILRQIVKRIPIKRPANAAKKSPWCKPTRRRFRKVVIYVDQYGNEVKMGNTDDEQTEIDEVPQDSKKSKASDVKSGDAKQEEISDDKLESRGRTRASKEDSKVLDTSDVMSQPAEGSEDTGRVTRQGRSSTHTSPAGHSPRGAVTSSGRRTSSPYASKSPPIRFKQEKARSPPQAPSSTVEQDKLSKAESARSPRDKTRSTSKRIRTVTESSDATISPNRSTPKSGHSPCHSPNRTSSVQNSSQAQVEKNQSPGGAAGEEVSRASGCSPNGPPSGSPTRASGSSPVRVSGSSPGRASSTQLTKTCADNSPSQPESTDPKDEKESQKEKENMEAKEESMEEDKEEENGDSPVKKRITRSQVTVQTEQRAKEVLTEPVPNMVIDEDKIKQLLVLCVENTHNFNLEQLERVYSRLSHCVFLHRNDYDKIHLTKSRRGKKYIHHCCISLYKDLETTINEIRRH